MQASTPSNPLIQSSSQPETDDNSTPSSPQPAGNWCGQQVTCHEPIPGWKLPKLEVRLSEVPGAIGLGLFSRKRKADDSRFIFRKGEKVMDIDGTLALRRKQRDSGRFLSWLVCKHYCHPIENDSRIMWSNTHYPRQNDVEFGCYPRTIAVYSNDSRDKKPNIQIDTWSEFPAVPPAKKARKLKPHEYPAYEVVALEDIPPETELFWSYGREGQEETDYEGSYLEKYDPDKHHQTILRKTNEVLDLDTEPKLVESGCDFNQIRINHESGYKPFNMPFSDYETVFCDKYALSENNTPSTAFLRESLRCDMFNTYLKFRIDWQIKQGNTLEESLEAMARGFKESVKSSHPELKKILKPTISFSVLYRYCVDQGIIIPEDDVTCIPYVWLKEYLEKEPDGARYSTLLISKISILLTQSEVPPKIIAAMLTRENVKHPVTRVAVWNWEDLEPLTLRSFHRDPQQENVDLLIDNYVSCERENLGNLSHCIHDYARAGNVPAIKAIIQRRLTSPSRLGEIADEFQAKQILIPVDGTYREADRKSLSSFIRAEFHENEYTGVMLNDYEVFSFDELIEKMEKNRQKKDIYTKATLNFLKKMETLEQGSIEHEKQAIRYMKVSLITKKNQHKTAAIKLLDNTHFLNRKATFSDVLQLLKGEKKILEILSPASTAESETEYLNLFHTLPPGNPRRDLLLKIRSHPSSEDLIKKCIIHDYELKQSKNKMYPCYYGNIATVLNRHSFTLDGQQHKWGATDVRAMIHSELAGK